MRREARTGTFVGWRGGREGAHWAVLVLTTQGIQEIEVLKGLCMSYHRRLGQTSFFPVLFRRLGGFKKFIHLMGFTPPEQESSSVYGLPQRAWSKEQSVCWCLQSRPWAGPKRRCTLWACIIGTTRAVEFRTGGSGFSQRSGYGLLQGDQHPLSSGIWWRGVPK